MVKTHGRADGSPAGILCIPALFTISETTPVRARAFAGGVWSPEIEFTFEVAPTLPTFLPTDSADWTSNANWSTSPAPYPDGIGSVAVIPGASLDDRNVNLRSPVSVGSVTFEQADTEFRNRVRDRLVGNTLTFSDSSGTAEVIINGNGTGFVEFENEAGVILESTLQLEVNNSLGDPDHGGLRLREQWSGSGGLIKTGIGMASLTGSGKDYSGATLVDEGVLRLTEPASPTGTSSIAVLPGGQFRLTSGTEVGEAPRDYGFGGPLSLSGIGRGIEIPDGEGFGKLGALRYETRRNRESGSHFFPGSSH